MHSRLTWDQQQHLHQQLQHLNTSSNLSHHHHIFEKCCCSLRPINGHHSQQHHNRHQHQLLQQAYQYQPLSHHHHPQPSHSLPHHHQQHRPIQQQSQQTPSLNEQQLSSPVLSVLSTHQQSQSQHCKQQQQQQQQQQHQQHSLAHHLYHQYHHHHHHHQALVATVTSSCSAVAAASLSSLPTTSPSSAILSPISPPAALSATASTMYRRHNNLSYCGVSSQDAGQNYQVQYVDTELYHSNSSQSQMTYPFCPIGDYQPNGQSYYSTTSTANYSTTIPLNTTSAHASALPYIVPVEESLLLNTSSQSHSRDSPHSLTEVAFIQETHSTSQTPTSTTTNPVNIGNINTVGGSSSGGGGDVSPEHEHGALGNTNKIASATIKWLSRNYETAEGVSLPRSTLYNHYIQHCNESKIEPVNAASFGKLIRSVFSGLRTRRLGTRGNSKYHYYGIRIKPESILNQMMEEKPTFQSQTMNTSHMTQNPTNPMTTCSSSPLVATSSVGHSINNVSNHGQQHNGRFSKKSHTFKSESHEACGQFLGNGAGAIPTFPPIEIDNTFDSELTQDDVETFRSMYREHCENFLDAVLNLEFNTIEFLWRDFWRENNNMEECVEEEKYLNKTKLYLLCHCSGVQKFVREIDYQFYQNMVDVIIPDVLRSIPNSLTQAVRNFAKNMEIWLCESMIGVPERMVQIKSSAVSAFCQTLRRYTSLNHLAQAARAVLQNNGQIQQMLNDLNRVDFHNVQEQAAWVCQCEPAIVQRLENDFKTALQQQSSLEQWAAWLQVVVDSALQDYCGKPGYAKAARQFLLKWSFYSSMIIRDLTLRSASSFGSFHLIRLLYDEYIFYLVEHKIAEAHQKTAIAVICDFKQKEVEFDFGYQLEFIATDSVANDRSAKRMKHE